MNPQLHPHSSSAAILAALEDTRRQRDVDQQALAAWMVNNITTITSREQAIAVAEIALTLNSDRDKATQLKLPTVLNTPLPPVSTLTATLVAKRIYQDDLIDLLSVPMLCTGGLATLEELRTFPNQLPAPGNTSRNAEGELWIAPS